MESHEIYREYNNMQDFHHLEVDIHSWRNEYYTDMKHQCISGVDESTCDCSTITPRTPVDVVRAFGPWGFHKSKIKTKLSSNKHHSRIFGLSGSQYNSAR
jgi:hypothetical protein